LPVFEETTGFAPHPDVLFSDDNAWYPTRGVARRSRRTTAKQGEEGNVTI
jgi:hypothetical protein